MGSGLKRKANILFAGLLLLLIALSVYADKLQAGAPIEGLIARLGRQVEAKEWRKARRTSEAINKEWAGKRLWISLEDSHQTILDFERTWAQCKVYLKDRDDVMVAAYIEDLKQLWKQLEG